jgi:hypothetical protein
MFSDALLVAPLEAGVIGCPTSGEVVEIDIIDVMSGSADPRLAVGVI